MEAQPLQYYNPYHVSNMFSQSGFSRLDYDPYYDELYKKKILYMYAKWSDRIKAAFETIDFYLILTLVASSYVTEVET